MKKVWAELSQVTFNISSHTETEFYNCAELMSKVKKRGALGDPPQGKKQAQTMLQEVIMPRKRGQLMFIQASV